MSSLNQVILLGRLGADPEIRQLPNGDSVASIRLATSEQWRDTNTGEKRERTEWHSVVVFDPAKVKVIEQYLKKGALVLVQGGLATRKWEDQSGTARYSTEIVIRQWGGNLVLMPNGGGGKPSPASSAEDYGETRTVEASGKPDLDDEIPF